MIAASRSATDRCALKRQRAQKKALQAAVAGSGWRRGIALENLTRYPLDDSQIAPTKFGNAIRAFETYGKTRFNLDSQSLWHELFSVAPNYIQSEIDSARSSVDFFVALLYLSVIFGLACLVLGVIEHFKIDILLLCVPAFLLAILCHWLAIRAVDGWSYSIQALVNTGRAKLANSLGLKLPETLEEEKTMWGSVTKYNFFGSREYGEELDALREELNREIKQTRDEPAGRSESYPGFVFFDIDEQYKTLFSDAMQGFSEYAKLKGYSITLAIDTSLPKKVGIKFVIMDVGVTVSTNTVRTDVDEYISKLKTSDNLRDMPIVTNPVEHERLVAAITMRFAYLKNEAELQAIQSVAYQRMFESVQHMTHKAIAHAPPQNLIQIYGQGDTNMGRDTYKAEHSPGASVGVGNITRIEGSSIIIGSSNEQRAHQAASVDALIQLVKASKLDDAEKASAVRHLENVREELNSNEKPDAGLIAKSLGRLKSVFETAAAGAELYDKAKDVFAVFGVTG